MTQPHYGGWDLPQKIWANMPSFSGRLDLEYFRLDIMKRLYRLGQKDPPLLELQKIRDEIDYMKGELEKIKNDE